MQQPEINLKETLNLPKTDFPIRASLAQKEPELLSHWDEINLDKKWVVSQKTATKNYVLHDGPPYPNGNIHMGHALNKVLKDIVVRQAVMNGANSTFIPGWDCHGLPIEVQLLKELKKEDQEDKKRDIPWFRERCKTFALDYVAAQKEEFKRIGIMGQWDRPYLTLDKSYEASVVKLFGQIAEKGLVYRGKKPIHWCSNCETALAEAEIEYHDHRSPSVYVKFAVTEPSEALSQLIGQDSASILVWTTTPWTLPANVAIAAHADFNYLIIRVAGGELYICVEELQSKLVDKLALEDVKLIGKITGKDLFGTQTRHPFIDRASGIVTANYVTKEDGTGFVHIAPGHGQEDYLVGLEYNLPIIMPVNAKGKFTQDVKWSGVAVFDANKLICQELEALGALLKCEFIKHSYPHCWRCKSPVIFRATEQWFIAMNEPMKGIGKTLRERALEEIRATTWYPAWGEKRIYAMVENRPDWCISRQRYWGIPIPAFICKSCNHAELTGEFNEAAADVVAAEGTMAWFSKSAAEILPSHLVCSECGGKDFDKEKDILDVWFESGSSFGSVLEGRDGMSFPADLYLEGSDQHRGWFQSSLLIGVATRNQAPFKAVLTHGFLVDDKGRKMSKSEGNVISPQDVITQMGADILRWWVVGTDFKNDVSIAQSILNQARDSYSKVRNTIRFLLSNLYDFEPESDVVPYELLEEIDQWILAKLAALYQETEKDYTQFSYHMIAHRIHDFCAVVLSATYLDIVKDRLYCGAKTSPQRRSTQTAIHHILKVLLKLLAPILIFTAEDAYRYFNAPEKQESIHLEKWAASEAAFENPALLEKWEELLKIKSLAYQVLEKMRAQKEIGSFLEAKVTLNLDKPIDFSDWESLLIVSSVEIASTNAPEMQVSAAPSSGEKCVRCWKIKPVTDALCERCHSVVYPEGVAVLEGKEV